MKLPPPSSTCASSELPPANASPSIVPLKSMIRRSPSAAAPSFALWRGLALLRRSSALSTSSETTSAHRPLDLDLAEVHGFEFRQHLEGHGVGEIGAAGEDLVDLLLVFRQRDVGLEGRALLSLGDGFAARLGDGLLHDFGHHRASIDFTQMRLRHMTGPEALELHPAAQIVEARRQAPLEFVRADHHLQLAAEALRGYFGNIHLCPSPLSSLVRAEGFEPPRPKPPEPKSGVSTSSTTPANARLLRGSITQLSRRSRGHISFSGGFVRIHMD